MHRINDPSRRRFLGLVGAGATLSLPACSGDSAAEPQAFGDAPAGNVAALVLGTLIAVPNAPAYVGRDADGVYAMTSTCTLSPSARARTMMASPPAAYFSALSTRLTTASWMARSSMFARGK